MSGRAVILAQGVRPLGCLLTPAHYQYSYVQKMGSFLGEQSFLSEEEGKKVGSSGLFKYFSLY